MRLTLLTLLTLVFTACGDKDTNTDDTNSGEDTEDSVGVPCEEDKDSDLSCAEFDCDDEDATIRPGAYEVYYDSIDQNCNGMEDDRDQDGDGVPFYGEDSPEKVIDCDDQNPSIHPYHEEVNANGIDEDCDGFIDNRQYLFDWDPGSVDIYICDQKVAISQLGIVYVNGETTSWDGSSPLVYTSPKWDTDVYVETGCLYGAVDFSMPTTEMQTVFILVTFEITGTNGTDFVELGAAPDVHCIVWGPEAGLVVDYMSSVEKKVCTELPGQPSWNDELKDWAYKTTW